MRRSTVILLAALALFLTACQGTAPRGAPPAATRPAEHRKTAPVSTASPTRMPRPRRPVGTAHPHPTATAKATPTQRLVPTETPAPHRRLARPTVRPVGVHPVHHAPTPGKPAGPLSWLEQDTLLTFYGRAFGVAPILGRLGMVNDFTGFEWQIQPYAHGLKDANGGKDPRIVIHLIYALAVPCSGNDNCLYYLDDAGVDIVRTYIQLAAQHHWLVVLDDQLGRSDPATEVRHMIDKGYLRYDNVEVALDPEFRTAPGQITPGIPVGSVTADEINQAQAIVNAYGQAHHLVHRKVMMVHQFQWQMIANRAALRSDFPYVDPVVVADGFGAPGLKAHVYSELFGPGSPGGVKWYGIKLFYPNSYENAGHGDDPLLTWRQVLGQAPAIDTDGKAYWIKPRPRVIVIA